jgi:hypothetical protein
MDFRDACRHAFGTWGLFLTLFMFEFSRVHNRENSIGFINNHEEFQSSSERTRGDPFANLRHEKYECLTRSVKGPTITAPPGHRPLPSWKSLRMSSVATSSIDYVRFLSMSERLLEFVAGTARKGAELRYATSCQLGLWIQSRYESDEISAQNFIGCH